MINVKSLLLALFAGAVLAVGGEAQGFDPRNNFDNSRAAPRDEQRRLSHEQLRAMVARQFRVLEMRTSGECGRDFWALIITREGHRQWVVLDVRDGRHVRTQDYAPSCR